MKIFSRIKFDIFNIFAKKGGSNVYPQSMFGIKCEKNSYTPVNPSFTALKWGFTGYTFLGHVFLMIMQMKPAMNYFLNVRPNSFMT